MTWNRLKLPAVLVAMLILWGCAVPQAHASPPGGEVLLSKGYYVLLERTSGEQAKVSYMKDGTYKIEYRATTQDAWADYADNGGVAGIDVSKVKSYLKVTYQYWKFSSSRKIPEGEIAHAQYTPPVRHTTVLAA